MMVVTLVLSVASHLWNTVALCNAHVVQLLSRVAALRRPLISRQQRSRGMQSGFTELAAFAVFISAVKTSRRSPRTSSARFAEPFCARAFFFCSEVNDDVLLKNISDCYFWRYYIKFNFLHKLDNQITISSQSLFFLVVMQPSLLKPG